MIIKKIIYIIIQKLKKSIEILFPGYYSENCKAIKKIISGKKISIKTVYDVGCYTGGWYKKRKKTFPKAETFYLFDAQNILNSKILNESIKFYNIVLGSTDGEKVNFWKDGGSGSSYFKEIGNTQWEDIEPETVTTTSLHSFIVNNDLAFPNYLKIDTQSTEIEILKGLGDLINNESLYFIELEISLYQINDGAVLIGDVIQFMSENNFVLISVEQLPIVEYFEEKKLVQLDGVFARRKLLSIN